MHDDICSAVAEDAQGANGDLDQAARIKRVKAELEAHVFAWLAEEDCGSGGWYGGQYRIQIPEGALPLVARLVAEAMVDQHDYNDRMWREALRGRDDTTPPNVFRRTKAPLRLVDPDTEGK